MGTGFIYSVGTFSDSTPAVHYHAVSYRQVEPALWLWAPDDGRDRPWRKFQHLYWPLPFSLTFLLWRIDSVRTAIGKKLKLEV